MRLLILEKSIMEGWKPTLSGWSILSLLCFKPIEPRTGKGWLRSWKRRSLIRNTWGQYWRSMACMINLKSSGASILERTEILNRIIEAKRKRRKELASLPYKEKIQILIQLQKFAEGVKKPGKKRKLSAWSIWLWTRPRPDNLLGEISKGILADHLLYDSFIVQLPTPLSSKSHLLAYNNPPQNNLGLTALWLFVLYYLT